ncbi:glycosyltransferase family 4 protein [Salegentibacter chungangensis]|uniref:Glycosyltransferase family 4 protein n=1 Tax=Salegentibacter chungangensis TaxID=1335724 RepID=A0ABW3NQH9_9FLAO
MRRLVYIGNKLESRGGAPTFTDTFVGMLKAEGFEVESASGFKNKPLRLSHMLFNILKNASAESLVLIDTYSTQNFWYAVYAGKLCRLLKLQYIPVLHGGNLQKRLNSNPKECKALFSNAKINVIPSPYLYHIFEDYGIKNITCIPNAIPVEDYDFEQRNSVQPKLLWVRAFDSIYNPLTAIKILEKILRSYPDAELCMVGPDKDGSLSECEKYALSRDLPVKFTGKLDKRQWIELSRDYDIFLNTSGIDNMPLSVIEAMALGFPVVSSNVGGIPHLISSGENGLLVDPGDIEDFAGSIDLLVKNPSKTATISAKAREKAKNFDWAKVKADWLQLLS